MRTHTRRRKIKRATTSKTSAKAPAARDPNADDLLDQNEAGRLIGAAGLTLKKSRQTGRLFGVSPPSYEKIGRAVRYQRSVVLAWLEEHAVTARHTAEASALRAMRSASQAEGRAPHTADS